MFGSGFSTLTILKEQTEDIMRTVKSLEESGLLIKGIGETIKNGAKERMLLGTLNTSISRNLKGN